MMILHFLSEFKIICGSGGQVAQPCQYESTEGTLDSHTIVYFLHS